TRPQAAQHTPGSGAGLDRHADAAIPDQRRPHARRAAGTESAWSRNGCADLHLQALGYRAGKSPGWPARTRCVGGGVGRAGPAAGQLEAYRRASGSGATTAWRQRHFRHAQRGTRALGAQRRTRRTPRPGPTTAWLRIRSLQEPSVTSGPVATLDGGCGRRAAARPGKLMQPAMTKVAAPRRAV